MNFSLNVSNNEFWLIGLCWKGKVLIFGSLEEHLGVCEESCSLVLVEHVYYVSIILYVDGDL